MINKSMRRLFAILLSALIMMSAVVPAVAAEDESGAPAESGQTLVEESKDESKAEELVVEEPKAVEPEDEETKDEEAKDEEAKDEETEDEEPKDEEPKDEEPKDEEPKDEESKDEEPKDEEPEDEEPKAEGPKAEEPKAEEPKVEEPKVEEPKAEEPKDEEPKAEEPKDEEPKDEEPKAEEAKVEETKDEEPKAEEKAFADLTVEEQYATLKEMSDEEIETALATLTEDQVGALRTYIEGLEPESYPETVVSTYAGPFMPAVKVESSARRRLLAKNAGSKGSGNTPDGLELDKNIVENPDGTYTITLDSYTTGEVTSTEISTPVDIVLVLDQSGSMAYDFDGDSSSYANSRQKAMKDAVQNFISTVHEKYSESADHRISIVTFGSDAATRVDWTFVNNDGYSTLNDSVAGLPQSPSGATNVAAGMGRAQHLVTDLLNYSGNNTTRQKVVVVFTDGVPTTASDFSTGVANGALNAAANIKNAGATIFTVGIFGGADPNELYGASGHFTNSNGSVNSRWEDWRILIFGDVEQADIPAGNRFLNYLSSNYGSVTQIGLNRSVLDLLVAERIRYTITANNQRASTGYYLTADNAEDLDALFQSIAEQIATPTIDLGSSTVVKDIIAPQLQIPEDATVKFFTQAYDGSAFTGAKTQVTDGSIYLVPGEEDPKTVSVSGFDFNANCVTEEEKEDHSHGKKLIIEITVEPDPNFLGGTIDTNGADSGIYPEGANTPIGTFPVPENPFKLKAIEPKSAERNIYLSTEDQLAETFSSLRFTVGNNEVNFNDLFNGVNNAGVNYELIIMDGDVVKGTYRIPAGKTPSDEDSGWASIDGSAPVLPAKEYIIDSVVKDKNDSMDPVVTEGRISLNVFKPTLTYADKNVYYAGAQIAIADVAPTEIVWKCGDTLDTAVHMDTTKPTLTYTYDGVTGTTVDQTTDYTVEVTAVKNGEVDLLTTYPEGSVTFKRNCSVESLTGVDATAAEAFKIHVYTPSFTFDDDVKYYGEAYTLPTVNTSSIEWKNGTTAAPSSMDNAVPAVTVALTPTPETAFSGGYVQVTTDVPVKAVITLGGTDVTAALITAEKVTRTCTPEVCETVPAATVDTAFVVHVKTVSLTIKKSIEGTYADMTKTYSFNVSYSGNVAYSFSESTFTLGHNGEKELTGLPIGTVTVEESGILEGYTVAFDLNGAPGNPKTPSEGKASESLTLTAGTEENTIVVHNTLATVPETGIRFNDGMSSTLLLMIALGGMAAMAVLSVVKRFSGRVKPVRK